MGAVEEQMHRQSQTCVLFFPLELGKLHISVFHHSNNLKL